MIENYDDQWTIVRELGQGAYGKVYEIRKNDFGHISTAALKVIRIPNDRTDVVNAKSQGMDEKGVITYYASVVKEIIKEIKTLAKLQGTTNIVNYQNHKVVSLKDEFGWEIYLQMELLKPLSKVMSEQKREMTELDVVNLGIDLCHALYKCKKKKIIHRDIKPANIFISDDGIYKLGDFGISRNGDVTFSEMSIKGTWEYMAPEVISNTNYSYSVDIYSLGIVMYQLLNDFRLPFFPPYPESISVLERNKAIEMRLSGEVPLPLPKHGDEALGKIILKAISYKSEVRYQSAKEMSKELEAVKKELLRRVSKDPLPNIAPIAMDSEESDVEQKQSKLPDTLGLGDAFDITVEGPKSIRKEKKKHFIKKRFLYALAGVALLACIIAFSTLQESEQVFRMYDLEGMTKKDAIEKVEGLGLSASVTKEYSDTVEKGKVISQLPEVNAEVKAGDEVTLIISKGEPYPKAPVPDGKVIGEDDIMVGDTVLFGQYEQDNHKDNGTEVIEWKVLSVDNEQALLQSVYGLDNKPYHDKFNGDVTWENCSLRKWLNEEFYQTAFSEEEQIKIKKVELQNDDNVKYGTEGGDSTEDKIFLLSLQSIGSFYHSKLEKKCTATKYAIANGALVTELDAVELE